LARFATTTLASLVLDRLFALAFTVLMSAAYGASRQLDDYLLAVVGPTLIAALFSDLFYSLLLPELMEASERPGEGQAGWNLLVWATAGLVLVTGVYALCWAVGIALTSRGRGAEPLLALGLVTSPLILLGGVSAMGGTVLVAARRYTVANARIPLASLATVLTFLVWTRLGSGVIGLAFSVVAGSLASAVLIVVAMVRFVGPPALTMPPAAAGRLFRRLREASLVQLATGIAAQAPTLIERLIAFSLGAGVLSSLNYGRALVSPPLLIGQSIATAAYPGFVDLSVKRSEGRHQALWSSIGMVFFLLLPLSILLAVQAHPLVLVVYHRGVFDDQSVVRTTIAASILAAGLVPIAVSAVLTRFLYAERAFDRVARAWLVVLTGYCAMALGLGHVAGYVGLAAASSASYYLLTAMLIYSVPITARWREFPWGSLLRTAFASALLAAAVLGFQAIIGEPTSLLTRVLLGAVAGLAGLTVYLTAAWVLRCPELFVTLALAGRLIVAGKNRSKGL